MPRALETARDPKASRIRVWQAVERIVRSGRRPTIEGVREILGGGSPNSVTAYINEWYQELGSRLTAAEAPMPGLPPHAVALLAELWRIAAGPHSGGSEATAMAVDELREAERGALLAETKALDTLNKELQKHRASAEKSLAETRALLARREAALEEERSNAAVLDQALAQTRLELEIAFERQRLVPARIASPTRNSHGRRRRTPAHLRRKSSRKLLRRRKPLRQSASKLRQPKRAVGTKRRRAKSGIKKRR